MDKFLVDLDSVLDKLEAEDADRCATDKLDDDEPCNLIGSNVYRNSDNDKIKKSIGGEGGSGGSGSGVSNFHSPHYKHHQESMFVNSSEKLTGNSNVIIGDGIDGGSCSSSSNGRKELNSFLSLSQPSPLLKENLLVNDDPGSFGNKISVIKTPINQIETQKTHSEKSSVTEVQVNTNLTDDCEDEPDLGSSISDIGGTDGTLKDGTNADIKGELTNTGNLDDKDLITSQEEEEEVEDKLTESSTSCSSHLDEQMKMQQSVNLQSTYNNTINSNRSESVNISKDINEEVKRGETTEYIGLVKNESLPTSTTTSSINTQSENKPIGEKVTMSDTNYGDLLLCNNSPLPSSSPSSSLPSSSSTTTPSNVLPKSNVLLENNLKGKVQIDSKLVEEVVEEESDEEMTEDEVKALEKELESELKRLNSQSEVETLEDIIESELKATNNLPTETIVSSSMTLLPSPILSSKSSVSPSTTSTTTTTTTTSSTSTSSSSSSSSSSPSPSSLSPSTSSSSLTLSKPIETSIASGSSLLINQPSESHQSTSSINESTINDNEGKMVNKEGENISPNISDNNKEINNIQSNNSLILSNKPVRPATLPLSNNAQSNQPGNTPMHGETADDELIPVSPSIPTEQTETQNAISSSSSSSSSQFPSTLNNQIEHDIVPENVQVSVSSIGYFKPFWLPDDDASQCMICDSKFTVMKRRHHCRACGRVLCAQCSRFKAPLAYLSYEKARVCDQCLPLLTEGGNISGQDNSFNDSGYYQAGQHPLGAEGLPTPSAPPPHHLLTASSSLSTTTTTTATSSLVTGATAQSSTSSSSVIQPVSVLRRPSKPRTGEPKQVIFSDGIRPGNDLKDDQVTSISHRRHAKKVKSPPIEKNSPGFPSSSSSSSKSRLSKRIVIQDANGQLPPILNASSLHSDPTFDHLITLLEKEDEPPVTFSLTKNLMALVKLVKLDCCTNEHCWSFTSQNLSTVGQDEIIVVVEKNSGENVLPRDIFRLFAYIYDSASKGYPFSELSHVLYPDGFFGCKDFPSFVFIRPTFQCLNKLPLPPAPFLIGILIHRFEVPWAKLFPLRLILRLGSKYRCYPCPVVSYRSRRPSYFEIGHTVMDILADFRNFQYTLPVIPGLTIHTEAKRTTVTFPKNRYDKVMKALGSSNEYVLSFGGTFSLTADSHLTCIQNDDGQYHTQTIKLIDDETSEPKITGASFIVFSGALKSSTGLMAKMSIVEDGLLVQVTANTLNSLKSSLKDMNDFIIECGKKDAPTNEESVSLIWGEDDKQFNLGVRSCIDGLSLEGINSIRMFSGTDFEGEKYLIRWVELFLIQNTELPRSSDGYDAGRAAEIIAQSFCPALVPCLESLIESQITKIGLRVTLDPDKIGYDVGSNGSPLPSNYINRLDAALIPIIMSNIAPNMEVRLVIELIFYILVK